MEVIIAQAQPTYFLAMAGFTSLNASAPAVSAVQSSSTCMYSLDPSASGALNMSANSTITSTCGIIIDSSNSQALIGASNTTITAPSLSIVGGESWSGHALPSDTSTGVAVVSDPLAYMAAPSAGGSCTTLPAVGPNATAGIPAGYYCGLTVRSNSTVNLTSSGTYWFDGTVDLKSNTTLDGSGVTLYFKNGSLSLAAIPL